MDLFSEEERNTLLQALTLVKNEDERCSLEQLHGFIFGLTITPDNIKPSEWISYILKDYCEDRNTGQQQRESLDSIHSAVANMKKRISNQGFEFPFQYKRPSGTQIKQMIEWCSGLQTSLLLRSSIWLEPISEQPSEQERQDFQEISFCFASLRAITTPSDIPTLFGQNLTDPDDMSDEEQMRLFVKCLQSLPYLVQSLLRVSTQRQRKNSDRLIH